MTVPKTTTAVQVYEVNGNEVEDFDEKMIAVESHCNDDQMIVLRVRKITYTVSATDLNRAISNCSD